jgi:hypothetical protein
MKGENLLLSWIVERIELKLFRLLAAWAKLFHMTYSSLFDFFFFGENKP